MLTPRQFATFNALIYLAVVLALLAAHPIALVLGTAGMWVAAYNLALLSIEFEGMTALEIMMRMRGWA